jgi:LPXTG-motif cell wall-anchored protein
LPQTATSAELFSLLAAALMLLGLILRVVNPRPQDAM